MIQELTREGFFLSTDPERLDVESVHEFLSRSYWAEGISKDVVTRSIEGALCYGIYDVSTNPHFGRQVGFGRVITDYATFAYLSDLFIEENSRGQGLSKWMIESMLAHPRLQGLRRWVLVTADAHSLYEPYGFEPLKNPQWYMEISKGNPYKKPIT